MTQTTRPIDTQRLTLILNDLRLPAIKQARPTSPHVPTRKNGPLPACSPPSSNTRSPNAIAGESNAIWPKPACRQERLSTASPSMPFP